MKNNYYISGKDAPIPDGLIGAVADLGFCEYLDSGAYTVVFTNNDRSKVCIVVAEDEDKSKYILSLVSGRNIHLPEIDRVNIDHKDYGIYIMKWYDDVQYTPEYLKEFRYHNFKKIEQWENANYRRKLPCSIDEAITIFLDVALKESRVYLDISTRNLGIANGVLVLRDFAVVPVD